MVITLNKHWTVYLASELLKRRKAALGLLLEVHFQNLPTFSEVGDFSRPEKEQ